MTILRHLNLAGLKVKSTPRLNLTPPRELEPPAASRGRERCEALSNMIAGLVCLFRTFFQARLFQKMSQVESDPIDAQIESPELMLE